MRLLIVDDEKEIAEYLKLILEDHFSCPCDVRHDGEEGLKAALEQRYDCIITDYQMPKITGSELIKLVRSGSNPNRETGVVMLSGFIDRELKNELNYPNIFYMNKPMLEEEFLGVVSSCLGDSGK